MPNTYPMQEIVRTVGESYADDQEHGVAVERPFIFAIPKGKQDAFQNEAN